MLLSFHYALAKGYPPVIKSCCFHRYQAESYISPSNTGAATVTSVLKKKKKAGVKRQQKKNTLHNKDEDDSLEWAYFLVVVE